jgi:CheY-like chemotaxis protein
VKKQILVVDDNAAATVLYERVIGKVFNCAAVCFTDPQAALEWASTNVPDFAVVDYRMPEMDGLEFIRRFRLLPDHSAIPCVVLTATKDPAVRQQSLQLGVVDFLTKPVNPDRLVDTIKRALKRQGGFP